MPITLMKRCKAREATGQEKTNVMVKKMLSPDGSFICINLAFSGRHSEKNEVTHTIDRC